MQISILSQAKLTKQDYVLQILKKLKLYAKLVPEKVHSVFSSKIICDYLYTTNIYKNNFTSRT